MQIQRFDDGRVSVSWPPVEGANAAIVSYINEAGELVYAHMVNDVLEDTVDLAMLGEPGIYTVRVTVGSEALGYTLCAETGTFTMEGEGPVHWGPAAGDDDEADECTVEIIAPRDIIANGLQTIFWSEVPGAESYRLRIYGQFDIAVADGAISAPATSMTMDVSEASIGVGYGGEPDFYIQINAYRDGESWCANGVRVTRNP